MRKYSLTYTYEVEAPNMDAAISIQPADLPDPTEIKAERKMELRLEQPENIQEFYEFLEFAAHELPCDHDAYPAVEQWKGYIQALNEHGLDASPSDLDDMIEFFKNIKEDLKWL